MMKLLIISVTYDMPQNWVSDTITRVTQNTINGELGLRPKETLKLSDPIGQEQNFGPKELTLGSNVYIYIYIFI